MAIWFWIALPAAAAAALYCRFGRRPTWGEASILAGAPMGLLASAKAAGWMAQAEQRPADLPLWAASAVLVVAAVAAAGVMAWVVRDEADPGRVASLEGSTCRPEKGDRP